MTIQNPRLIRWIARAILEHTQGSLEQAEAAAQAALAARAKYWREHTYPIAEHDKVVRPED